LKRSFLWALALAMAVSVLGTGMRVDAKPAKATPAPSASPSAEPTATPEPPDKAIPRLLDKLKADPNDTDAMVDLSQQYLSVGRADLAVVLTTKLLQLGKKTAQVYFLDGLANEELNRIPQSIYDYEQASNLDPTNVGVLGALTQAYLKTNRYADAERVAKRSVTFNKDDKRAFINYGLVLATEGKYDDARAQLQVAVNMDKTDPLPLLQIAQTYFSQNNYPQTIAYIDQAIAVDPHNLQAFMFKGDVYAKQHDIVNALAAYEQAVTVATDDDTRAGIVDKEAAFLAQEKKNDQAEATFQRAITAYPAVMMTHVTFGDYWASINQPQRAVDQWTQGLGPNKDTGAALIRLGEFNLRNDHATQAIEYLRRLTEVQPDPQSFALLGQAYTFTHDYRDARDACIKSYQAGPTPDALGCIAGADFELKNYKESAAIFDTLESHARGYTDSNPQLLFVEGKVYEQTNQKSKAVASYKRLLVRIKPGTPDYKKIQAMIAALDKPAPAKKTDPKTKHG